MDISAKALSDMLGAFNATILNHNDELVGEFLNDYVRAVNPLQILSGLNGLERLTEKIFVNAEIRDFMSDLQFRFWFLFGSDTTKAKILTDSLTESLTHYISGSQNTEYLTVPDELLKRLPTFGDVDSLVRNNRWIVVFVLLCWISGTPDYIRQLDPVRKRNETRTRTNG